MGDHTSTKDRRKAKDDKTNVNLCTLHAEFDYTIQPHTTGRQVFDQIVEQLNVKEVWFFGLEFTDTKGFSTWLKLKKKVFSQDVGKKRPVQLRFRAKFFPEDVHKELLDPATQRQFFLQVREGVLTERLYAPPDTALLLASYGLQALRGDHSPATHPHGFLNSEQFLPKKVIQQYELSPQQWEERVVSFYRDHKGLPREQAMVEYLRIAQDLEMFGVAYFDIRNKKGTELMLGVDALGLNVYEKDNKLTPKIGFPWSEVKSISFSEKKFIIKPVDDKCPNFIFYVSRVRVNKKILALCMGNHELYVRRRKISPTDQLRSHTVISAPKRGKTSLLQENANTKTDTEVVISTVTSSMPSTTTPVTSSVTYAQLNPETRSPRPATNGFTHLGSGDTASPEDTSHPPSPRSDAIPTDLSHYDDVGSPLVEDRTPSPRSGVTPQPSVTNDLHVQFSDEEGDPRNHTPTPGPPDSPYSPTPPPTPSPTPNGSAVEGPGGDGSRTPTPLHDGPLNDDFETLDRKKEYTAEFMVEMSHRSEAERKEFLERELNIIKNKDEYEKLKVKQPVVCPNQHVFCGCCMEVWLQRNSQCPACRCNITADHPCRPVLGGLNPQSGAEEKSFTRELRRSRMELIYKDYENEIDRLEAELQATNLENQELRKFMKTKPQSGDRQSPPKDVEKLVALNNKLKDAMGLYEKVKTDLTHFRKESGSAKEEAVSLRHENQRLREEVVSRSPRRFGRYTVAALENRVDALEKQNTQLKRALEKSDTYIEDLEKEMEKRRNENALSSHNHAKSGKKTTSDVPEFDTPKDLSGFGDSSELPSRITNNSELTSDMHSGLDDSDADFFMQDKKKAKKNVVDLDQSDFGLEMPSSMTNTPGGTPSKLDTNFSTDNIRVNIDDDSFKLPLPYDNSDSTLSSCKKKLRFNFTGDSASSNANIQLDANQIKGNPTYPLSGFNSLNNVGGSNMFMNGQVRPFSASLPMPLGNPGSAPTRPVWPGVVNPMGPEQNTGLFLSQASHSRDQNLFSTGFDSRPPPSSTLSAATLFGPPPSTVVNSVNHISGNNSSDNKFASSLSASVAANTPQVSHRIQTPSEDLNGTADIEDCMRIMDEAERKLEKHNQGTPVSAQNHIHTIPSSYMATQHTSTSTSSSAVASLSSVVMPAMTQNSAAARFLQPSLPASHSSSSESVGDRGSHNTRSHNKNPVFLSS